MRDQEDIVEEIKKEIIESRGLVIKISNLTNSLASDIKVIAKRQAGYEQRFHWNSAVAYVLFALLSFAGLKLASDARIAEMESEKKQLKAINEQLQKDLGQERQRMLRREQTEERAMQFYQLIRQQKKQEVVDGFANLKQVPLSKVEAEVFRESVERFKVDLSWSTYQEGLELVRAGRFAEATDVLTRAISYADRASHIPATKYQLAYALSRLDRCPDSVARLREVLDQSIDRDVHEVATRLLAKCTATLGNVSEARNILKSFLRKWPKSDQATQVRQELSDLGKK